MQLFHTTGKTWYKVLYQHTMYVINLSNISIKTNFKQITIKINKFVQYSNEDYIFYMTSRYVLPFIYQSRVTVRDHFQCHCTIVRQYAFLEKFWQYRCRKYWNYALEIKIRQWIRDIYYEWMIIKQSLCLSLTLICSPLHSNNMTSWQSSSAEQIWCNVTPFFYHHSVVIQHLVSDRLISSISEC
jgi:hypothetical protein